MTHGPTISNDPLHNRLAIGSENRAAPLSATSSGSEFLKSFLSFSSSSGVQNLSASLQLDQLTSVFKPSEPSRVFDLSKPHSTGPAREFSDQEAEDEFTRARSTRYGNEELALNRLHDLRVERERHATNSADLAPTKPADQPESVHPDSDDSALLIYSPGFLDPQGEDDSRSAKRPLLPEPDHSFIALPLPKSELADVSRRELDPLSRREAIPTANAAVQSLQLVTLPSDLTPVTDGADIHSQDTASRIQNLDPRILYRSHFYREGTIAIDPKSLAKQGSDPETHKALTDLLKSATSPETSKSVDAVSRHAKAESVQNRVASLSPAQVAVNPAELSSSAQMTDFDVEEAVEISFKPDRPVSQTTESAEPSRYERRVQNRTTGKTTMIGQHPGAAEPKTAVYSRNDRPNSVKSVASGGSEFSMGELQVLPIGQRAVLESGMGQGVVPPAQTDLAALVLNEVLPNSVNVATANASVVATPTAFGTPATVEAQVNTTMTSHTVSDVMDANTTVQEITSGSKAVPSRLMNQVAQALRQAPAGDSTMRLQLNPAELGQLAIEITFRDGVMHGKLRAEQGQTFKLLQEGLEGLRARLSEQGIVVQTLEVELGQQGDFSQQQQSFTQAQDFGRQRHSNGYFSADDRAARRAAIEKETPSGAAPRDTSGRWAVNVIV